MKTNFVFLNILIFTLHINLVSMNSLTTIKCPLSKYFLESGVREIIKCNSVLNPLRNIDIFWHRTLSSNPNIKGLEYYLIILTLKLTRDYFCPELKRLSEKQLDQKLADFIFKILKNPKKYKSDYDTDIAKLIIAGANPNLVVNINYEKFQFKGTLLMLIAQGKISKNLINLLISYGVDIDLQEDQGKTALMLAIEYGNYDMARILIKGGANVNIQDHAENSALSYIAIFNRKKLLKSLINNGANVNVINKDKRTPLMLSVISNKKNKGIIRKLVKYGANINFADQFGESPLSYAEKLGNTKIKDLLLNQNT